MNPFLVAVFLSTINSKIVDLIKQPILQWKPEANLWYFSYISILSGIALNWLARVNLLAEYVPSEDAGVLITGLGIGAGSWFLYEVFMDKPATIKATAESGGEVTAVGIKAVPPG